ncbi:MAG: L,D-transpeptidase ErfK/SrfK [Solirubrobacterales bacterium]|jgi:lipoprotein-anchoring transpeptidase ErfK/SrfK|nr:L,D-transpeptidase ErfK/SrfK [Solirubrobacterales bacterium]
MSNLKERISNMSRVAKIAVIAVPITVLLAVGAAFAYDASKQDQISEGVQIAGIDVGGQSRSQAKALIKKTVVAPLMRPVEVKLEGQTYELTPSSLHMKADVNGMLNEAIDASRQGGLPSRLVRYATGGTVNTDLAPRIAYSSAMLQQEVKRIAGEINRDPVDAHIAASPQSLNEEPGQDGLKVDEDKLHSDLEAALQQGNNREVTPVVSRVPPSVTEAQLATKYPTYLTIDRGNFKLTLWKNLKVKKTYDIAVGQSGLETPAGTYTIDDKQVDPSWHVPNSPWAGSLAGQVIPPGPADPLVARWMGFYNGAGIHGTNEPSSIGSAASHGCVRMRVDDVIDLYDRVPLGTPIYIGN